jgi:hypothetical protein
MKLVNTSTVPDTTLKQVIKYCLPRGLCLNDVSRIDFGNTERGFHGRAWGNTRRVHVGVPHYTKYRFKKCSGGFRGYLPINIYSWEEHLVELVAHELRHIWQYKNKERLPREVKRIRKMNLGTRASLSEVDASLYAKRVVRQYRKDNTFAVNK